MPLDRDEPQYWLEVAGHLESAHMPIARRIEERERLYHTEWDMPREEGIEYVIDKTPEYVGDRARGKIVAQPYVLTCRTDLSDALAGPDPELGANYDPAGLQEWQEAAKLQARKKADQIEATMRGIMAQIENQQGLSLDRMLSYNAVIDGYAGPVRVGYDELAASEKNYRCIPLTVQVLDPRSCFVIPDSGAGIGPRMVIYKKRAQKRALLHEGWDVVDDAKFLSVSLETEMTVYDCWEKVRVREGDGMVCQIWHCMIVSGGAEYNLSDFLKAPVDMTKARGIWRIPYVMRPVAPKPYTLAGFEDRQAKGFLDVLADNFDIRCKILSWQAQMVAQRVNPSTIQKTKQPVDVDLVTPGASNQIDIDEEIEIPRMDTRPEIAQAWGMLEQLTQRGTFASATFGEGVNQQSGLMTGRLQEAGEEPLGDPRVAVEGALADVYSVVGMFAAVYLQEGSYKVRQGRNEVAPLDVSVLSGHEIYDVTLPGMSKAEQAQQAAIFKQLSEPRPDGSKFLSDETARELSGLVPYAHLEEGRITAEQDRTVDLEKIKDEIRTRNAMRAENVKDQMAQGQAAIELEREKAKAQAEFQQEMAKAAGTNNLEAPENPGPNAQGVARTPAQPVPPGPNGQQGGPPERMRGV